MAHIVYIRAKVNESKEALVLRTLGAGSLAHAVTMYHLENFEGDIWQKLEGIAVREIEHRRGCRRVSRLFRKIGQSLR